MNAAVVDDSPSTPSEAQETHNQPQPAPDPPSQFPRPEMQEIGKSADEPVERKGA